MKKLLILFSFFLFSNGYSQVPAYYSSINFSQTGLPLRDDLASLITSTHTNPLSYADVWNVLKAGDLDPTNSADVLLIYGYNDGDGNPVTDRTRNKNNNGGSNGEWNREHTFAKSQGNPDLGSVGPGSDAHNLRASDVQQNGNRSNKLFASGSGNAGNAGSNWYPGDEWKGDVARIIMYRYLRYGLQCRPYYACAGTTNSVDANMVDLLLDWNAEDPVSTLEENRNDVIQGAQGNRNPFIDNPRIATYIWGGTPAEDTWGGLETEDEVENDLFIYPIPSDGQNVYISNSTYENIESISIYNSLGELVTYYPIEKSQNTPIHLQNLPKGLLFVNIDFQGEIITKKLLVQ